MIITIILRVLAKTKESIIKPKFKLCPSCTSQSAIDVIYCPACDYNFNNFVYDSVNDGGICNIKIIF